MAYMSRKRFIRRIIIASLVLLLGGLIFYCAVDTIISNDILTTKEYTVASEKIVEPVTIVQLTDLHNYEFGVNNKDLIALIEAQNPDIIVITGDMVNTNDPDVETTVNLCKGLLSIAPVYYSLGNHELDHFGNYGDNLTSALFTEGVTVLELGYKDIEVNGSLLRIGGISGYPYTGEARDYQSRGYMEALSGAEHFKLLLAHQPEGMIVWGGMEHYNIDLTLSGHTHGGQVRLPFVGAVYAPDQGRFPTYDEGLFEKGYGTIIISSGLGSSGIVPRFNNPPEVTLIRLVPEA